MYEHFIKDMKQHPFYDDFVKMLLAQRPSVPAHNPHSDNTEVWKSASAQQQGFDLCLTYLGVSKND